MAHFIAHVLEVLKFVQLILENLSLVRQRIPHFITEIASDICKPLYNCMRIRQKLAFHRRWWRKAIWAQFNFVCRRAYVSACSFFSVFPRTHEQIHILDRQLGLWATNARKPDFTVYIDEKYLDKSFPTVGWKHFEAMFFVAWNGDNSSQHRKWHSSIQHTIHTAFIIYTKSCVCSHWILFDFGVLRRILHEMQCLESAGKSKRSCDLCLYIACYLWQDDEQKKSCKHKQQRR